MRHNKKRNAAIIYEQLVRFISKSLVEGNEKSAKEAMSIVEEYFKPGTQLHKEFRLFNALVRTTVGTESLAIRILDEARRGVQQHDAKSLDREKGLLIHSINKRLNVQNFFEQRVPDYRSLATVQTLMNDWRNVETADIARIVEYEQKVIEMLLQEKKQPNLEKNGSVSSLSLDIMKKKVSEKMSRELTSEQFRLIKFSLTGEKEKLEPILETIKRNTLHGIYEFKKKNKNAILGEKIEGVKLHVESLSPSDTTEENVSRFLVLNELLNEMNGDEDAK